MTKAQAIKALGKLGWTDIQPDGRYSIRATSPEGKRVLADPRDLLAEVTPALQKVAALAIQACELWKAGLPSGEVIEQLNQEAHAALARRAQS